MQRLAVSLSLTLALSWAAACTPIGIQIAQARRESYYKEFIGKHSSEVMQTFGIPDSGEKSGGLYYATYLVPIGDGTVRKILFVVGEDETVVNVNYWPK